LRNRFAKSACATAPCGIRSDNIPNRKTVARKPKTPSDEKPAEDRPVPSEDGKLSTPEPKKKARVSAATAKKKKPAGARKPAAKRATTTDPHSSASTRPEPTDEEIRLRAYFLAERRHRLSLPGDSNHDWIEARRQLIEEASR
jgi:Protein of unknown function (DUF2934)